MLASKYKLKTRIHFARTEIDGYLIQSKSFGLSYYLRSDSLDPKFAVVVSTKISKKAVERNRIRRLFFQIIAKNIDKFKRGCDYIFLVKHYAASQTTDSLENEINNIITKVL